MLVNSELFHKFTDESVVIVAVVVVSMTADYLHETYRL